MGALALAALFNPWTQFDAFLFLVSLNGVFIQPYIGSNSQAYGALKVLKVLRLARILRALRLVHQLRTLWLLVKGLVDTFGLMFHTVLLTLLVCYIYTCIGLEILCKDKDSYPEHIAIHIEENFCSVPKFMLNLIQISLLWRTEQNVYNPIVFWNWWMAFYFLSFILLVGIALMNLLTGIIVEGCFDRTRNDQELEDQQRNELSKRILPELFLVFRDLDADGSGEITVNEIKTAPKEVQSQLHKMVNKHDLEELLRICDKDGNGKVSLEEFFEGVTDLCVKQIPLMELRMMRKLVMLLDRLDETPQEVVGALTAATDLHAGGSKQSKHPSIVPA